jgi:GNAT superfamily N-acetyltransferase
MFHQPAIPATLRTELAELQSRLSDDADREAFVQMVFPRPVRPRQPVVQVRTDAPGQPALLASWIVLPGGGGFTVREPADPRELGPLLRLFLQEKYLRPADATDRYLAVLDAQQRVVGGLGYASSRPDAAFLQDLAVAAPLRGQGLGSALLEDFCARLANAGIPLIQVPYHRNPFYEARGFRPDPRWGGLVRYLE